MKLMKKTIALFLVILTIFTTCSVIMPVIASSELVTASNVTSGNAPETEAELTESPEILSEIIEKREENTKHFLMSDGTFMVAQYAAPVHYQDDSGQWIDYNNNVAKADATTEQTELFGTDELYSTSNLTENVVFAEKSNSNTLVSYEVKDYPISLNYQSAKKSKIKVIEEEIELTGNDAFLTLPDVTQEVVYEDIFNNVDLQYIVSPTELKENIILKSENAQNTFIVNYNIGELTATVVDSKTVNLTAGDEIVYTITAPYMYDANGEKSENIFFAVDKNQNGKLRIDITADSEWLQAENRAYPVVIDPSIITETSKDAIDSVMISKNNPERNYSKQAETVVGREESIYGYCRVLTKINLPGLNKGDIIVKAQFNMSNTELSSRSSAPDLQVNAHRIEDSWEISSVTWSNQPSHDTIVADYDIMEPFTGTSVWRVFDITRIAKQWYEEEEENCGILLKSSIEDDSLSFNEYGAKVKFYVDRYNQNTYNYPKIILTYRNNKGLEDYWTYTTLSAGTAGTAYINDYTGNLVFIHGDVSTTGELMPVSLEHVYNGYMAGSHSGVYPRAGVGFKLSLQQTVKSSSNYGLSGESLELFPYAYEDGDGTVHYFYKETENGVTKYLDEDGLNLELEILDNGYKITDKSGNVMTFGPKGNMTSIADAEGRAATLSYTSATDTNGNSQSFLKKITDGAGHTIQLTYNSSSSDANKCHLTSIKGPDGKTINYTYNSANRLKKIIYPDGNYSEYTYDTDSALIEAKSSDGYKLTFTYSTDGAKRVASVTESSGNTTGQKIVFTRDKLGQTKIETAGNDAVFGSDDDLITTYQFDNFGRTVSTKMNLRSGTSLGAEKYDYTLGSEASGTDLGKRNRVSASAATGKNINNLLDNHNFENTTRWAATHWLKSSYADIGTAGFSATDKYIGKKSIKISVNDISTMTVDGGMAMNQNTSIYSSSGTYTLSAYVKTESVTVRDGASRGGACLAVRITDAKGDYIRDYSEMITGTTDATLDNGWQRVYLTFTVPNGATACRVYPVLYNAQGTAFFDCVQLEKNSAVNSYNLLENASFENGTDNWAAYNCDSGDVISTAINNGGAQSYKLVGSANADKYIRQTVYVSGSEKDTYIISGNVRANSVPLDMEAGRRMDLAVKITYTDGTTKIKRPTLFNGEVTGAWQYASGIFTLSDDDKSTNKVPESIVVYCGYRKQANSCYFDDISLIKEPAPTYSYDDEGNLVSATQNAEKTSALTYDGKNNLSSFTDERGGVYNYTYATSGNTHRLLSAKSNATGITYAYSYYGNGNVKAQEIKNTENTTKIIRTGINYTAESGSIKEGAYVLRENDQHGNSVTYDYNLQSGLLNSVTDPNGNVTSYTYDVNNLLTGVTAGNSAVTYTYNDKGTRLNSITHNGFNYNFQYDAFGNVQKTLVGNQPLMTNEYQGVNGNLIKSTYGNDTVKTYEYNNYGQTTRVNIDGKNTYYWRYNNSGQPYMHTDYTTNRVYYYTYDSLGRIIRQYEKTNGADEYRFASQYTYDLSNNLKREVNVADGATVSTRHTYDTENRPTKTTLSSNVDFTYTYDHLGRINYYYLNIGDAKVLYNPVYYASNRNAEESTTYQTTQIQREEIGDRGYAYTYGKRGNITGITEKKTANGSYAAKVNYTYDALGQLKTENNVDLGERIVYTYDNGGNITSKKIYAYTNGTVGALKKTITYGYDSTWKDKLISLKTKLGTETTETTQSIEYDAIGNPTNYMDAEMTWNGRQLESYEKGTTEVEYKYDADGLRTQKTVGTTLHEYEYSGGRLYYEKRGNLKFYYRYNSLGNLASITRINANNAKFTVYVVTNSRGDVEELRNDDGTLYARYVYDSWGNTIKILDANGAVVTNQNALSLQNPIRYRGYYFDAETGLYYLQSRYYDPVTGRFVSADSYVSTGQGVLGYNMYAYCGNNPVNRHDETGLRWKAAGNFLKKAWSSFKSWVKGTFGAEHTVASVTKYEDEIFEFPINLLITKKEGIKTTTYSQKPKSNKPVTLYSQSRSDNVLLSSTGLKVNTSKVSLNASLCLENVGISGSWNSEGVTNSFSVTTDITQFKIGFESSTTVVASWDSNSTITEYTNVSVTGWAIMAYAYAYVYGHMPVEVPVRIPQKVYS